ncbi:hypothetical protein L3V83_13360 [Thiotrichales bacterium 19X7-9]|nr:hypothetical protein [Thiotrichales bacterium 19X7-9]
MGSYIGKQKGMSNREIAKSFEMTPEAKIHGLNVIIKKLINTESEQRLDSNRARIMKNIVGNLTTNALADPDIIKEMTKNLELVLDFAKQKKWDSVTNLLNGLSEIKIPLQKRTSSPPTPTYDSVMSGDDIYTSLSEYHL